MLNVVIHNAEEAIEACVPFVNDDIESRRAFAKHVDPDETLIGPVLPFEIYGSSEVPYGWYVFYGNADSAKNMRETEKPGDAESILDEWPLLVNRWTGAVTREGVFYPLTLSIHARRYIRQELPSEQRDACQSALWKYRWDHNDPVRFEPPVLEFDTSAGIEQEMDLTLEVDASYLVYFGGKPPRLSVRAVFSKQRTIVYKWELVSTHETDTTHLYHFKLYLNIDGYGSFIDGTDRCYGDIIRPASETGWDTTTDDLLWEYNVKLSKALVR